MRVAALLTVALTIIFGGLAHAEPAWGIYPNDPTYLTVAGNLGLPATGTRYVRMGADAALGATSANIAKAAAIRAAGMLPELTIAYQHPSCYDAHAGTYGTISCAPASVGVSDATFRGQVAAVIDAVCPCGLINLHNETDGHDTNGYGSFFQDLGGAAVTTAAYLHELTLAVQVAHSTGPAPYDGSGVARHYLITGDAMSSAGQDLAYWHYLHLTGQFAARDAFAASNLFPADAVSGQPLIGHLPTLASPTTPILAQRLGAAASMAFTETILPAYAATGIDCLNFHWYAIQGDTANEAAVVAWLKAQSGMTALCSNEMGQRDPSTITTIAMVAAARAMGLSHAIWFTVQGQEVQPLSNPDGSLNPFGIAFRDAIAVPAPMLLGVHCHLCFGSATVEDATPTALAIGANLVRVDLPLSWPLVDRLGASHFVTADVTTNAGAVWTFADVSWARAADSVTAPLLIAGTKIATVNVAGHTLTLTNPLTQYIYANTGELAAIANARAAHLPLQIELLNTVNGQRFTGPCLSAPICQAAITLTLSQVSATGPLPAIVGWGNEEDSINEGATPAQYGADLTTLCGVVHGLGLKCTNGGLTGTGADLLWWFETFCTPGSTLTACTPADAAHQATADAFSAKVFNKFGENFLTADLPNSCLPAQGIMQTPASPATTTGSIDALGNLTVTAASGFINLGVTVNATGEPAGVTIASQTSGFPRGALGVYVLAGPFAAVSSEAMTLTGFQHGSQSRILARALALVPYYQSAGIDYFNRHWFNTPAPAEAQATAGLAALIGKPAIINAVDTFSQSGSAVTQVLATGAALRLPVMAWYSQDTGIRGVALTNPDNSLRLSGAAFRAFAAAPFANLLINAPAGPPACLQSGAPFAPGRVTPVGALPATGAPQGVPPIKVGASPPPGSPP